MDLRLALLLLCLCRGGITNVEETDEEAVPSVPLIPLVPSLPAKNVENAITSQSANINAIQNATVAPAVASKPDGNLSEEDEDEECVSLGRNPQSREAIVDAMQRLGIQLLQMLPTTPEEPNVIISPLSISLALSQLALGAVNETQELLMQHLHGNALPCYHDSLHNILMQLHNSDLQIATRIFLSQGFEAKQQFVHQSQQLYDSETVALEGLEQINKWVEKATNGKITKFFSSLPPNLLLMLINAIHFKGEWKARFDPRFTSKGAFNIDDKHLVDVEMMEGANHPLSTFIDSELEAQVARFSFQKLMSLLVVVPMSDQVNVSTLIPKLNVSDLYERLPKERAVQVKVPKFKLENSRELKDILTNLGLGEMFSKPNLANIADGPLLVSKIMHKVCMEIHEEGAEAAAATSVVISRASNPIFSLNRPFFLALIDDTTQVPILMGVITNPNPGAPVLEGGEAGSKDKMGFLSDKNDLRPYSVPPK
ncbi:serpin peptidase inhibitor, clade F (alpha-2 antiplasmin, pigment epithelium derived factor), member 2b [Lampris incognitus]|uniref:serpin peptidase inhibitor, clade F (alpha-2 antiplasmin, pigment epithelium derived factor), member 2b n=1 Tax=Lampris incognitus TaxID=2546036 RepID=UPI0024B48551|nr:serpin peptidase inhibitor, clade F (alpha-2 antiplasmin, pigment epithelium derived factor), member 2b [Lampris incognitus]XP_056139474.1 serpin peptidase inhibitor, clade F (alpha-2 antiplasmin, pigment epithelium derived factor), member 2b [Lampris incognitus]XP_056139475.1 serpin peptidase inhibitor, clade F (alpha-2 antiplasmin, pigment epithelium derived factor), member 2b [Lampris incognitus]